MFDYDFIIINEYENIINIQRNYCSKNLNKKIPLIKKESVVSAVHEVLKLLSKLILGGWRTNIVQTDTIR